jgi:ATP-dependent RNA helicase RhlB
MRFDELNLDPSVMKGIEDAGFVDCTEVQEICFNNTLKDRDVFVQSQTGTGKTAAFLISVFQLYATGKFAGMQTVIIVPTRELATQIEEEVLLLGKHTGLKVGCFYGGVGYAKQEEAARNGVDIIIGTPGRLIDFSDSKKIDFGKTGMLVIDEADRLFDMGFMPDLRKMLKRMPSVETRQTMLFSATLNLRVRQLAWEYMNEPAEIEISPENLTVDNISQHLYHVGEDEKINLLLGIMKQRNPKGVIIFTNMKRVAYEVARRLEHNGYKCEYLMGDLPQSKRLRIIDKVKNGLVPVLVATDVAARGLHIDDLELVVNYDVPLESENYIHRIGRTARAGKSGVAVTFCCERYVYGLEAIEKLLEKKIPVDWADEDLFVEDSSKGISFHFSKTSQGSHDRHSRKKQTTHQNRDNKTSRRTKPHGHTKGEYQKDVTKERTVSPERKHTNQNNSQKNIQKPDYKAQKKNHIKKNNQRPYNNRSNTQENIKLKKNASLEDRVEYYKKKYGEDFKVPKEMLKKDKQNKSLWTKVKKVISGKK